LLAEDGFQSFGVNAVARKAGCDKQLVYRYFGGLDGLAEAIGEDLANWVRDKVPEDTGGRFFLTYADLAEQLILLFLAALRSDPLMQRIIAWEMAEPSPVVRKMADARSKGLARWIDKMRGTLKPPAGLDAPVVNAVLIAACQHLVLSAAATGSFAGVGLQTEKEWERINLALRRLIQSALG
jgi:AcrR family transcriptional regulator